MYFTTHIDFNISFVWFNTITFYTWDASLQYTISCFPIVLLSFSFNFSKECSMHFFINSAPSKIVTMSLPSIVLLVLIPKHYSSAWSIRDGNYMHNGYYFGNIYISATPLRRYSTWLHSTQIYACIYFTEQKLWKFTLISSHFTKYPTYYHLTELQFVIYCYMHRSHVLCCL